jgi:hypothetical protein
MIKEAENLRVLTAKQNKATEDIMTKFNLHDKETEQQLSQLRSEAGTHVHDLQAFRAQLYEYVVDRLIGFGGSAKDYTLGKLEVKDVVKCSNGTICTVYIGYQPICYHYYSCPTWPCEISELESFYWFFITG